LKLNKLKDLENHTNSIDFTNILKIILVTIIILPSAFLLINLKPYLMVLSVFISLLIAIIFFTFKPVITYYHKYVLSFLSLVYVYLILSYFLSNQDIHQFFSYNFLKNDGNFFFCYMPFFIFAVPFFDYKRALRYFLLVIFSVFFEF